MITRASALLNCNPCYRAQIDCVRAQVLLRLCQSRLSVEDLALALNCSESMIRTLLASLYRHLIPIDGRGRLHPNGPVDIDLAIELAGSVTLDSDPLSTGDRSRVVEQQAHLLGMEVRRWLCTFEMTDRDRQYHCRRWSLKS